MATVLSIIILIAGLSLIVFVMGLVAALRVSSTDSQTEELRQVSNRNEKSTKEQHNQVPYSNKKI